MGRGQGDLDLNMWVGLGFIISGSFLKGASMLYRVRSFVMVMGVVLMGAVSVGAQPFTFDLVADQADLVPGQTGLSFVGFHAPSLAGTQGVFRCFL